MEYGESMNLWKWPDTQGYGADDAYKILPGVQTILTPNSLVYFNRNITFEFLFTGVTAADAGTKIQIYTAIVPAMLTVANASKIISAVDMDATTVTNPTIGFARDIRGIDSGYFRLVLTGPAAPTASLRLWAKSGGYIQ